MTLRQILVADDEESLRHLLFELLTDRGYEVALAQDGEEALRELEKGGYDAVLADVRMPRLDGLELVRKVSAIAPDLTVILMSAYGSHELALEAVKAGAYDYIGKPFRPDELVLLLRKAEERERLRQQNRLLIKQLAAAKLPLVAESPAMREVVGVAQKAALGPTTLLLSGESGTGKEVLARTIHELSPRRERPFVPVNCGAIPAALVESELFGHEKGAFTGAVGRHRGLFEEADGGTLFLDEVAELPLQLQVSLLRVLQQGEIRRVGGTKPLRVDVRVIAATHRDLLREVQEGRFREDLYYRLNVIRIHIPPLRERPEDVEALAARFLSQHAVRLQSPARKLSPQALARLLAFPWPGNVRELENALERAVVLSDAEEIEPELLPEAIREPERKPPPRPSTGDLSVKRAQRAMEAELIARALEQTQGNRTRAAELLELSPRALLYKIRDYGLD